MCSPWGKMAAADISNNTGKNDNYFSVAGLAELRSVSVDMPAKKDLEYVGNGHVAYANSVNLTFFKPSSDELSIE